MTWILIDHYNKKELQIKNYCTLTFGSSAELDVCIKSKNNKSVYFQITFDKFFFFKVENNVVTSHHKSKIYRNSDIALEIFYETDKKNINFSEYFEENSEFLFKDKKDKNFYHKEINLIFCDPIFQESFKHVKQNLIHSNIDQLLLKNTNSNEVILKSCAYLDPFFWSARSPNQNTDTHYFQKIIFCICTQIMHYGPLSFLLLDDDISEILINRHDNIYYEMEGRLYLSSIFFENNQFLLNTIERIVILNGRKIDESNPFCDARLADGSRVHAIIPPLSLTGPTLTIRKFPKISLTMESMLETKCFPPDLFNTFKQMVSAKNNILISGGTGTGKTTFLNCLSAYIPIYERIITIEDSAELKLQQPHVVRLECRIKNTEMKGEINIRTLLKNALRMRPDRIIVGECRGAEALDMLQAMNTGHEGSMTTVHANSPYDALKRLETLVLYSEIELPSRAIREQIVSAIHYIVHLKRSSNGQRFVHSLIKLNGLCETTLKFKTKIIYESEKDV